MHCWVKCPSCNNYIAHLFRAFKGMRGLKNKQEQDNLLDVFELLGIKCWCCKTRLMAVREFNEFLHSN
jgi:DNA-directed RNA polymerase subunit N (RpoN/RPB10)